MEEFPLFLRDVALHDIDYRTTSILARHRLAASMTGGKKLAGSTAAKDFASR
jgi:hypothetical protein